MTILAYQQSGKNTANTRVENNSHPNRPAVLSSGLGQMGPDLIGSDRSFEFRCRTAAGPERRGTIST
ncbi:hypothetical protein H5410_055449, partial [Solanum commersonii]